MKRLIVTGTRRGWPDEKLVEAGLFAAYSVLNPGTPGQPVTLVHGAAPGIDIQAKRIWESKGLPTEPHEALWKTYGKGAGPIRNQEMVDAGADLCVAFPDAESSGTWDCIKRARKAGITVLIMGEIKEPS